MKSKRAVFAGVCALLIAGFVPSSVFSDTITFDSLAHGEIINTQFTSMGVTISAINPNRTFDLAAAFDTDENGTSDSDLEFSGGGFDGGNLGGISPNPLGVIMILSENDGGAPGDLTDPDDEGQRPGGSFTFTFSTAVTSFGFDFLDVQSGEYEKGTPTNSRVEFFSGAASQEIFFEDFPGGIVFGDNFANTVAPTLASDLNFVSFDKVIIHMGGSGGVDNISFTPVPEPGTWLLIGLGVVGLVARGRRNK